MTRTRARITVVTAGHPSTCPRMVKAADAFADAGHEVRMVCTRFIGWATETDRDLLASRPWKVQVVNFERRSAPVRSRYVGLRRHAARAIAAALGVDASPWWAVTRAYAYVHPELVRAALASPADLFYGGTTGALAAVAEAATRAGRPCGLDLEDLHTAESDEPDAPLQHALAARILRRVLPVARFVTTSSSLIGDAYREQFGVETSTIHNVFPLPAETPAFDRPRGPLKLYWFSQTIGPLRGIEDAINAVGAAGIEAVLTLRGRVDAPYLAALQTLAAPYSARLVLDIVPPTAPDRIPADARHHDVGLSGEVSHVTSRQLCLPNKIFTYLCAGLAVAITDTPAQRSLIAELGAGAGVYHGGEPLALATWFRYLAADPRHLADARRAAWAAAVRRWHWEHALERGRLQALAEGQLS